MKKRAFTLIELLIVIIIIGILASIALPNFAGMKENALNKEAFANLKLIQAAQKIYKMETDRYYVSGGGDNAAINQNLKLSLPAGANRNWTYATGANGCGIATRNGDNYRDWFLNINDEGDPRSTGNCP